MKKIKQMKKLTFLVKAVKSIKVTCLYFFLYLVNFSGFFRIGLEKGYCEDENSFFKGY